MIAREYNKGMNNLDLAWPTVYFVFDFCMILFDVPAFIWYGWLKVLYEGDLCSNPIDIWTQPHVGLLFFVSYYGI